VTAPVEATRILDYLAKNRNITGGLALSRYFKDRPNDILVSVTELNSRQQIDDLVAGMAEAVA
jgi:glycine cleavage system pyridoxal-binding protein P